MNPKLKIVIAVIVALGILLGSYFVGNSTLANAIKSSYQSKNCEQVLSQSSFYANVYPASIADQSVADMANECALYALAVETEGKKTWQDAYNAYKAYMDHYPRGFFFSDAQEHSALVLTALAKEQLAAKKYTEALATMDTIQRGFGKTNAAEEAASLKPELYLAWAKDQLAARKYSDAVGNINLVLQSFGKTSAAKDAASLMSEIYIAWAKDQRDASDFAKSGETLKAFKAWAESANRPDDAKSAQRELAQTYLAWGMSILEQKQFEDAKAKLDLAISMDPLPTAESSPAAQAKAAQAKLYIEWGDTLLEKNDFTGAIGHYQTAVSSSESKDQPAVKDKIAATHLKQAASLNSTEDFLAALKEVEQAKEIGVSESVKKDIETAQAKIYQAFSQSTEEQAQQVMADAAKKICINEELVLPIFGGDPNAIRAYLYIPGNTSNLTDAVRATTPASLHYVACVTVSADKETWKRNRGKYFYGRWVTIPGSYYTIERVTNHWDVQIYDLKTGKMVASQLFTGSTVSSQYMADFMEKNNTSDDISFVGTVPSLETISKWVKNYMK